MAKTNTAPFTQTKKTATAVLTAAKTTYNDTTNAVLLYTAGAEGDLIRRITAVPRATVSASQLMLFRSLDGGVTLTFDRAVVMPASNVAATTAVVPTDFGVDFSKPMSLAGGATPERLYVATGVALAAGIVVTAEGEAF
jgi:hypothetical protein